MDESLGSSLRADLVAGTSFSSATNAINTEAEQLRKEGCNVVVCIAHTLNAKTFATRLRGIDALIAGHEHINLNEKVTGADGKTIHVVEAGSAFAEVGLLSVPYEYDTKGTESTDDDTVTVPADGSDEKLYTAKNVNDLLADPDKGSDYQSRLEAVRNKIKPLDEDFENESNKVLGTSTTNYFYGEDAAGTHGWEMVRTTDFRPSKEGDTTKAQTIGHVICGSYLALTGADLAIENAGGIRGGIAAGDRQRHRHLALRQHRGDLDHDRRGLPRSARALATNQRRVQSQLRASASLRGSRPYRAGGARQVQVAR